MERRKKYCLFGILMIFLSITNAEEETSRPVGICAMKGCNCTVKAHRWVFVKCVFSDDQDVELSEGIIPEDTMEVDISHCRELKIQTGAFSSGGQLKRVHVSGIYTLVANKQAFQNLTSPNPLLEISECNRVIFESYSFKNTKGPLSVSISKCKHVTINPHSFSWLLQITVKEVPYLELATNAFKFDTPQHGRHGPATKIMFQSVKIPELTSAVFPSIAAEIRMNDLWTRTIKKDAFCAMNILSITISNASIFDIEAGAFSDRTLIHNLEFVDVRIKNLRNGAFRAGANNLTIQYSSIHEIEPNAIDIPVATVTFNNNEFRNVRRNSIAFRQWNKISIDNNLFQLLESYSITTKSDASKTSTFEFSFSGNQITTAEANSLNFIEISQSVNAVRVGSNYFKKTCNCNLEAWVQEIVGSNGSVSWIMDTSYCVVDKDLRNCFNIPEGYLGTRNYTQTICSKNRSINCIKPREKPQPSATPPSVGPHHYPKIKGYFNVEMSDFDQLEREKRIIVIVCVCAVFFLIIVILTSGILYIRRRGVCPKLSSGQMSNLANSWISPNGGMTAATSARSISRLSIHEYSGFHPESRILETDINPDSNDGEEEALAGIENKATQTFPDELTEDYLRELKERLNDPDNYSIARDIIEHLYDLIRVDENSNNNNERRQSGDGAAGNSYDFINSRKTRVPQRATIGTRVPSLDKLLPKVSQPKPELVEYSQPHDHKNVDQNHLYMELPGDETVPSTSRLTEPVLATLAGRAPLPLPPDVLIDNRVKVKDSAKESDRYVSYQLRDEKKQSSFLKVLGDTITGGNNKETRHKRSNSLLGDYASPSEVTVHLYSELPEPKNRNSMPSNKMANRPLPTKPDQENISSIDT